MGASGPVAYRRTFSPPLGASFDIRMQRGPWTICGHRSPTDWKPSRGIAPGSTAFASIGSGECAFDGWTIMHSKVKIVDSHRRRAPT